MLLGKTKLNTIKNLISMALIDSYINHDKYVSVNNVLTLFLLGGGGDSPPPPPCYTFINNFLFTCAFFVKFSDFS